MSKATDIRESMEVYGPGDRLLGRVERLHGDGFHVAGAHYQRASVARVTKDRVCVRGTSAAETGATTDAALANAVEIRKRVVEEQQGVPVSLRREEVTVREVDTVDRPLRACEGAFEEGVSGWRCAARRRSSPRRRSSRTRSSSIRR